MPEDYGDWDGTERWRWPRDYNYRFAPRWKVPPQVLAHTVTLQARATDTGGNQTLSAPVFVRVTP